jgi:hypothetical protein
MSEMDVDEVFPSSITPAPHASATASGGGGGLLLDFMSGDFGQMGGTFGKEKQQHVFDTPIGSLLPRPPPPAAILNATMRNNRYAVDEDDAMYGGRSRAATFHMV